MVRQRVVSVMESWEGRKEGSPGHREIIDIYNSRKPLPRGYKMTYKDAWCAATVSAAAIKAGLTDIMPPECSCSKMIALYQKLGRYIENDGYIPKPGDLVFYDWQDNGVGDNRGAPDHVGMVVSVQPGMFTVMEGNKNNTVGRRSLAVNGRYIRGFAAPNFDGNSKPSQTGQKQPKVGFASHRDNRIAKSYTVAAEGGLWLRTDAGKNNPTVALMPKDLRVTCYGYYSKVGNEVWPLVAVTDTRSTYRKYRGLTGFCSMAYLK